MNKGKVKRKVGRPEAGENVREGVLDAAEVVFSKYGYYGATLKKVADAVGVTQAVINYYFSSKEGLYHAVFMRRAWQISNERLELLDKIKKEGGVTPRKIFEAFLLPVINLRKTEGGRAFIRLQARLHTEPPEISYSLRRDAYDASTRKFAEALKAALPAATEKDVYWKLTLLIGAYMYVFSDTHRLEEYAPGICNTDDNEEVLSQIIDFSVSGVLNCMD